MIWRWVFVMAIGVTGCLPRPCEIHPLDILDSSNVSKPVPTTQVYKFFVVSHPPETDSLVRLALEYSKKLTGVYPTLDIWVQYSFYRETRFTPRDFRETSERNGRIDVHGEDGILDIVHTRSAANECWFVHLPRESQPSKYSHCIATEGLHDSEGSAPAQP